ncbi:hypothetical protein H2248_007400 [Termitomyces sp. 'cryptogamus']|nr:hypothetical protein H2248_007400 [Termitomyces sp. 'cryptogamus']
MVRVVQIHRKNSFSHYSFPSLPCFFPYEPSVQTYTVFEYHMLRSPFYIFKIFITIAIAIAIASPSIHLSYPALYHSFSRKLFMICSRYTFTYPCTSLLFIKFSHLP